MDRRFESICRVTRGLGADVGDTLMMVSLEVGCLNYIWVWADDRS
jgi:hypothetical protein